MQASRYRGRHGVSGAKSDRGDSHMLADVVRTDSHQLRPAAGDPAGAASGFAAGFEPLVELLRDPDGPGIVSAFENLLSSRDSELLRDRGFAAALEETEREALRPGTSGGGWDNVSWIGEWDIDLGAVTSPVLLWYGSEDRFAPPAHGLWLSRHLPRARLVLRDGEGHFGIYEHLGEMLDALTEPDAP